MMVDVLAEIRTIAGWLGWSHMRMASLHPGMPELLVGLAPGVVPAEGSPFESWLEPLPELGDDLAEIWRAVAAWRGGDQNRRSVALDWSARGVVAVLSELQPDNPRRRFVRMAGHSIEDCLRSALAQMVEGAVHA